MCSRSRSTSTDGLRDGARAALRGRITNALLVVAAIERVPSELAGRADEITLNFPWGSLLRGIVRAEPAVLRGLAALARPGAPLRLLLSIGARDAASGVRPEDLLGIRLCAGRFADAGLWLERCQQATTDEVNASGSSWAKRLGARRPVLSMRLRRLPSAALC